MTIPINAPRCCGGGCKQGDSPDACDCGVGAPSACDMERVQKDVCAEFMAWQRRTANPVRMYHKECLPQIDGPYRRPGLLARIVSFFWSKA